MIIGTIDRNTFVLIFFLTVSANSKRLGAVKTTTNVPNVVSIRPQSSSAAISWHSAIDPPATVRSYKISYGVSGPFEHEIYVPANFSTTIIRNLVPSTAYIVKVNAIMVDGRETLGEEDTFMTKHASPAEPLLSPTELRATFITSTEIHVSWYFQQPFVRADSNKHPGEDDEDIRDDDDGGDDVVFDISVREGHSPNNPIFKPAVMQSSVVGRTSAILSKLQPNTMYDVSVRGVVVNQTSPWSLVLEVKTRPIQVPFYQVLRPYSSTVILTCALILFGGVFCVVGLFMHCCRLRQRSHPSPRANTGEHKSARNPYADIFIRSFRQSPDDICGPRLKALAMIESTTATETTNATDRRSQSDCCRQSKTSSVSTFNDRPSPGSVGNAATKMASCYVDSEAVLISSRQQGAIASRQVIVRSNDADHGRITVRPLARTCTASESISSSSIGSSIHLAEMHQQLRNNPFTLQQNNDSVANGELNTSTYSSGSNGSNWWMRNPMNSYLNCPRSLDDDVFRLPVISDEYDDADLCEPRKTKHNNRYGESHEMKMIRLEPKVFKRRSSTQQDMVVNNDLNIDNIMEDLKAISAAQDLI